MTYQQDLTSQFIHVGIQGSKRWNAKDKFKQLLDHYIAKYNNGFYVAWIFKMQSPKQIT